MAPAHVVTVSRRYTPRHPDISYVGRQRFFWTICTHLRRPYFVTEPVVGPVRSHFFHTAEVAEVAILAYCFMPDHVHLLLQGQTEGSPVEQSVIRAKQQSGYWFQKEHGNRLWQKSSWDRVLRRDEDTLAVIRYIVANPVRAGLVVRPSAYPFSGSAEYSWDQLESAFD